MKPNGRWGGTVDFTGAASAQVENVIKFYAPFQFVPASLPNRITRAIDDDDPNVTYTYGARFHNPRGLLQLFTIMAPL